MESIQNFLKNAFQTIKKIFGLGWMPALLFLFAWGCWICAKYHFEIVDSTDYQRELAETLMGLASTIFIGGVLKFFIDLYQNTKEQRAIKKSFRNEILSDLRAVVDEVELSKILIRTHKSALTYGRCMRDKIMPGNIRLWDIKRTLVNQKDPFLGPATILDLRAHIHSMVAYLELLIDEFEKEYITLSNLQKYQEGARSNQVKAMNNSFNDKTERVELVQFENSWKVIKELKHCKDFLFKEELEKEGTAQEEPPEDTIFSSRYDEYFISHYNACKRLLRDGKKGRLKITVKKEPAKTEVMLQYEALQKALRKKREEDLRNGKMKNSNGDLVKMIKEEITTLSQ